MVTIRVRRRFASLGSLLLVVGLLPVLGGSVTPRASVILAAGSPQGVTSTPSARPPAVGGGPAGQATAGAPPVGDAVQAPLGAAQDLFLFPTLALAPQPIGKKLAKVAGQPGFIWPVHGPEASGFGPRIHPVLGRPMFHTGIDLMAACGTPIRAAADGQVIYAAITPSWGRRVIIRHTSHLETGYAHMSRFLVQSGDTVKQGDLIGLVGTTGWSTGCHLHFDVIVDGQYVDPAPYLGLPASASARIPYGSAPHLVLDGTGTVVHTVEDGDVPIPPSVPVSSSPSSTASPYPTTSTPTGSATTSQPTTTTASPTTTTASPTSTTASPTSTTTTASPTSSTSEPATTEPTTTTAPTTSEPSTTTTTDPPTSTTTSEPSTTTTTEPPTSTTTAPATSDTTTSASTPTATETATESAVALATTTAAAIVTTAADPTTSDTTSAPATSSSDPLSTEP